MLFSVHIQAAFQIAPSCSSRPRIVSRTPSLLFCYDYAQFYYYLSIFHDTSLVWSVYELLCLGEVEEKSIT